jgi:hypothetical protein
MPWIDIVLPPTGACQETDRRLDEARAVAGSIPGLQERHGLDSPAVTQRIEEAGRLLFAAATAADSELFRPDDDRPGAADPRGGVGRLGFHLVADEQQLGLPWTWLHNGVEFLLEKYAITAARHGSRVPEADPPRLWMQRHSDALFAGEVGEPERSRPEILFVPGHGRDEIRRLMFREAEGIDQSLQSSSNPRGRLRIPGSVTPGLLAARAMLYQALHFAAPTSQPPEVSGAGENRWLAGLIAAAGHQDADAVDELVGQDMEILGVDPVEAAIDQAVEAHARRGAEVSVGSGAGLAGAAPGWMLEDGPVCPEHLGRDGVLPPLIFSNSWCSLAWLGQRFLDAGASTFVGTAIPLFSRPARLFAALFYGFLGDGQTAGLAHRNAALALREKLGPEHPAWLAYGLQGYACLRLSDL